MTRMIVKELIKPYKSSVFISFYFAVLVERFLEVRLFCFVFFIEILNIITHVLITEWRSRALGLYILDFRFNNAENLLFVMKVILHS